MTATSFDPPVAGLAVLDGSLNPIWLNATAVDILCYPAKAEVGRAKASLGLKLRPVLLRAQTEPDGGAVEFTSGKRRYNCHAFSLKSCGKGTSQRAIGLLFERSSPSNGVSHLADQFKLTPRQRGVVELLTQGLTNKEIASRMSISSNTVKAHIRLIMIKTRVSTRSGLLGKIIAPDLVERPPSFGEQDGDRLRD